MGQVFAIEKNVPIPGAAFRKGNKKYPLKEMRVGDSFFVPCAKPAVPRIAANLSCAAWHFREMGRSYTVRRCSKDAQPIGVRVWRLK